MPSNNFNQQVRRTSAAKGQCTVTSFRVGRKAAGTRWGTLQDWRESSNGTAKNSRRHGHAIRDGRQ